MTKTNIQSRAGNFTSSQIFKLMTNDRKGTGIGAPGLNYIAEKKMEMKLGRQLQIETSSAASLWGTYVQHRVTNVLLDTSCIPTKDVRRAHPLYANWTGAEDYLRSDCIGEIKCFELKNFCQTHDAATAGYESLKEECPEIFWQLVSNVILCDKKIAELTLYVPYKSELETIRNENEWQNILPPGIFESDKFKFWLRQINFKDDNELPYLLPDTHYPNSSIFEFEIKDEDKTALFNRVVLADKLLNENYKKV